MKFEKIADLDDNKFHWLGGVKRLTFTGIYNFELIPI